MINSAPARLVSSISTASNLVHRAPAPSHQYQRGGTNLWHVESEIDSSRVDQLSAENAALRKSVALLEAQIADQAARTNEIIAQSQETTYWLSRWHVDLNSLMMKPGAAQFRGLLRAVRAPVRLAKKIKRAIVR